ncbi:hypothetical protein SRHO_G00188010 [Serrasalmus rhombeus]
MMDPHHFSSGDGTSDSKLQTYKAEPPEPSCVSMKSSNSMFVRPGFSNERTSTDLRAEPPEPSCVSMKSSNSMFVPPGFSDGRTSTDLRLQTFRAETPEPSCVSMKSSNSMFKPLGFSDGRTSTDLSCVNDMSLQSQSKCGVCEQIQTDPVSINCGHTFCRQCINSYWNQSAESGDFACPRCRKTFKTRPVTHPCSNTEESMKPNYCHPVGDVLHRVLKRHKTTMKNKYESMFEGFKTQENKTLLNRIYTQLYIIEGESEGVNEELQQPFRSPLSTSTV